MKKIAIFFLLCMALCACNETSQHKQAPKPTFVSYWEGFNFGNKQMIGNPGITEAKFQDFCTFLSQVEQKERTQQIDTLLARSERGSKEMFLGFMDLAEKYLLDPNSPYKNEESYIPFLQYGINQSKVEEAYKERYKYQLANAQKNRVGTIANDFEYVTREGVEGTLRKIGTNYTIIYFNNPECHDCKRVFEIIKSSSTLAHLMTKGDLTLLALYPDESLTAWNKHKDSYPYSWTVARYKNQASRDSYNLPAIPSIYLLDKRKKVIYKDAPIEEVESYLIKAFNL